MGALAWLPWADAAWWRAVVERTAPDADGPASGWCAGARLSGDTFCPDGAAPAWVLWLPVALGVALVAIPPLWRLVRIGVTLVHELGHAVVGVLVGRRFTGFVVRGDMSGHAVTVGKRRGPGLALTTWAGYPMPALVGAGLVWVALAGWAPLLLLLVALGCVVTLPFVRSWTTAGVTLLVGLAAGALWWWRSDARSVTVVLVVAAVLVLGAWRHWAAVAPSPRGSDPAELARQTGWPGWFWVGTQLVVIAAATALAGWLLWRSFA
ncbi:M50 family metallopeptidase [Salana multivorans]|uniref:M50 family metallopeptidase n=1 Tax=Salana multivorans TaxID=120377 RepID=UPI000AD1362B|nr:M50 family metallopeptidase [Salana multivorans]